MKIKNTRTLVDVELKDGIVIQVAVYDDKSSKTNGYYLSDVRVGNDDYDLTDDDASFEFAYILEGIYNEEIKSRLVEQGDMDEDEDVEFNDVFEYVMIDAVDFAAKQLNK